MSKPTFEMTGHKDLDKLLKQINKGDDIDIEVPSGIFSGDTALMLASSNEYIDLVKLLIDNGADVNIQNEYGDTALMSACRYNNDVEICKLLIENGANVNIQNENGNTALIFASEHGYIDICRFLIENGADINIKNKFGETSLIVSSKKGNLELSKLLIENGADLNIQNKDGKNSLMYALFYEHIELGKVLIGNGADLNLQDKYSNTALMVASASGCTDICKLLIENGADVNVKDDDGETAIDIMNTYEIYTEVEPYKILGLKHFQKVFEEHAEAYMDIFETTLYSQNLELEDIKANIDMFYSNVVAKIENNTINENVEL